MKIVGTYFKPTRTDHHKRKRQAGWFLLHESLLTEKMKDILLRQRQLEVSEPARCVDMIWTLAPFC